MADLEETISLQDLFKTLRKRLVLIISAVILAVTLAGVVSYLYLTPIYKASTQILVTQKENDQQYNSQDIQTNLQLINTYKLIIKSPAILSIVAEKLDINTSPGMLNSQIAVNSEQSSQVVNISVQDVDHRNAVDIANVTAEVFQEEIKTLMNVDNVNILSPAVHAQNPSPIKPDPLLNMAIAAVIGLMLGIGLAFLLEYLDKTVKSEQDIEELLELPILGLVGPIPNNEGIRRRRERKGRWLKKKTKLETAKRKLITRNNPKAIHSEQYRTIRTNINFSMPDRELQTLLFTSALPRDGKSTTAANAAIVFAQEGKKVLLVDVDMRKPTVHHTFELMNGLGLSNVLTRQATISEVANESGTEGLDIITCGPIPPNPAELLSSQMMETVLEEMKKAYDMVIFDSPPLLSVSDAQILSNRCDGTILVINSGITEKDGAVKAKEMLASSKAHIIGAVLNNFKIDKDHYFYQYYGTVE